MTALQDAVKAAAQTYVYGYPLVYSMEEIARFSAGTTSSSTARPHISASPPH